MTSGSDFGAHLRRARERKGVSLREIAARTKISMAVLEALERNDLSRLPGGLFSRAFVRSYAHEVGLDPERTVEHFIEQFPTASVTAGTPQSSEADDNEAIESERRVAQTALKLILVSIPVAGALIYFTVTGRQTATPPERPVDHVTSDAPVAVAPEAGSPGMGAPNASASTSGTEPSAPLVLSIHPIAKCWVSLTVDGERRAGRMLKPGDDLRLSATSEIVFTLGDAAALQVTINGSPARPFGASGQVVTRRITLQNYRSLLLP